MSYVRTAIAVAIAGTVTFAAALALSAGPGSVSAIGGYNKCKFGECAAAPTSVRVR